MSSSDGRAVSIKMILSSSIVLTSCEYSIKHNVRVVEPYLCYYSILNCCRCFLYKIPSPFMEWNDGELMTMNHSKAINYTVDYLKIASRTLANRFENDMSILKYYRELFSYHFPANGLGSVKNGITFNGIVERCKLLVELAQYNSSLLHKAFVRKSNYKHRAFTLKGEYASKGFIYEGKNEMLIDKDDYYRISYICRKYNVIYSLYHTMTEGMTEDFFGAWCSDKEGYNPDENWKMIFDIP